jgi:short-subunit dehydrogenase
VILVARSTARLEDLAQRIRRGGAAATVLPADLSQPHAAQRLHAEVNERGLAIDLLVNNAGFGYWGPFEAETPQHMHAQLQVNVVALAELTRLFVPELLARQGVVLNIASTAGFQASPYMSTYAATKAFVMSFSEALWAEYRGRGLRVATVCPGPVDTAFIDAMGPGVRSTPIFRRPLPTETVVDACLAALGGTGPTTVVGWRNWLLAQSSRFSPRGMSARIGALLLRPR